MKLMKRLWALPLLLLWSCEFQSYEEHEAKVYDGVLSYRQITGKADWKNRYDHAALAYDGKLWVLGGYNPGEVKTDTYYEDVWNSEDGETWELVTASAPWKGRRGHTVNVFDDGSGEAMYLIGGFEVDEESGHRHYTNDVWRSVNGADWVQVKERYYPNIDSTDEYHQRVSPPLDSLEDWFPRMNHATVVATHNDTSYLYIIGGVSQLEKRNTRYAMKYFNDVWRSGNGSEWTRVWNNDFGIRASHAAAVDPGTGRIFIQGGQHGAMFESDHNLSHPLENWHWLWSSADGKNWIPENDTATFEQSYLWRTEHSMVFYNNTLWTFSGSSTSLMHYQFTYPGHYPTWCYNDGLWSVDSEGTAIKPRHSYSTVVFKEKIWFLGGYTSDNGQNNDVWSAEL